MSKYMDREVNWHLQSMGDGYNAAFGVENIVESDNSWSLDVAFNRRNA